MTLPLVHEVRRLKTPLPEPQALAYDGEVLWLSSRATRDVYAFAPEGGTASRVHRAPEIAWGLAFDGTTLRAVCGGPNDDRAVFSCNRDSGFEAASVPCPDGTGSYVAWDGAQLYLTQWYRKRVYAFDGDDAVLVGEAPRGICGATFVDGTLHLLTTADEERDDYVLVRAARNGAGMAFDDVATVPFKGRSLAWDGRTFWSNHRERDELVAFTA